jgi:hypothetical protein
MSSYHMPEEEPDWPFEPEEMDCTCNQVLCLAGVAEWCAFCQAEYNTWLDQQSEFLPMEFYVLTTREVASLEAHRQGQWMPERNAAA